MELTDYNIKKIKQQINFGLKLLISGILVGVTTLMLAYFEFLPVFFIAMGLFGGLILFLLGLLGTLGFYNTMIKTKITDTEYYSPGWRSGITVLRISNDGLMLKFKSFKKGDLYGFGYHKRTVPFRDILFIYPTEYKSRFPKAENIQFHVFTRSIYFGTITTASRDESQIIKYLKKYLGSNWDDVYCEDWDHIKAVIANQYGIEFYMKPM
jgi:hypothetical protein